MVAWLLRTDLGSSYSANIQRSLVVLYAYGFSGGCCTGQSTYRSLYGHALLYGRRHFSVQAISAHSLNN